ncbi:two-component system sensor histidine kinase PgtB [Serratia microhaemolytica]|uniref:two-component system sensor histidine kinase PgtB n=1 Tax=Serratia microhaemolytica TaxID=2675110 RepID=UPI000FDDE41E|nr:ATP-binding protein [Serratia microhaemolytica]
MSRLLLRQIKRMSISGSLRMAFIAGALLTLTISGVSLYAWQQQDEQIRYALSDYFPRVKNAFAIENSVNRLVDQLNEFLRAGNTDRRLQLKNQIVAQLEQIERVALRLDSAERAQLQAMLTESRELLNQLDSALYSVFVAGEKVHEISARLSWLHDDFSTELTSLIEDLSWQQGSLLDQMEQAGQAMPRLQASLRTIQREQQQIYALARIENQIIDTLRDHLNQLVSHKQPVSLQEHSRYLNGLKKTAAESVQLLAAYPSTVTLRQTIDELLEIGIADQHMPMVVNNYLQAHHTLVQVTQAKEEALAYLRAQLGSQLNHSHRQMQHLHHRLEQIVDLSGGVIILTTLLALLLAYLLNHYFIRSRLVKRFTLLNQSVIRIGSGDANTSIPVYGVDELGRIARLLRHTLGQLKQQNVKLQQQIVEKHQIELHLRTTQDELVQAAKLAVVGQTMTTLAHEINQPLHALSLYLFSAKQAVEQQQPDYAMSALTKASTLIGRVDSIIRMLRNFTRRVESDGRLQPVDLRQVLLVAWEWLSFRHQPLSGVLKLPQGTISVQGDLVGIQQVLVNLLNNALDACPTAPVIELNWQRNGEHCQVMLWDNGTGWPLALADSLLKPFTTSKEIGLGIGLSISHSLMLQMQGSLHLASTMTQNACVVLQFQATD